jgi:predicted DNA-binding transcriptional regulator AlpA
MNEQRWQQQLADAAPGRAFLTIAETARRLAVSESTVRRLIADGSLPAVTSTSEAGD